MSHTYTNCLMHCVFSTKTRADLITPDIKDRLFEYMGGIARTNQMKALAVGGTANHVHVLLSIPATITVSRAMQLIKGASSKWVHDTFKGSVLEWQEGYGAFSIGLSGVDDTLKYIQNQEEHHKKKTFQEEIEAFLRKNGIQFPHP